MIQAGKPALAEDFIEESSGATDEGKVPKLNEEGKLDSSFGTPNIQEFTEDGTWIRPATGHWVYVELWGAGGSGGVHRSTNNTGIGAGGGGACSRTASTSEKITLISGAGSNGFARITTV